MKRKIILSLALALSIVLVSLIKSDSTVSAEPPQRFTFDTGLVQLGSNQILRVSIAGQGSGDPILTEFRKLTYTQTACDAGVCKQAISSQTVSAPLALAPSEAAVIDCEGYAYCRVVVSSNSPKVRVNAQLIDAATGETQVLVALLLP
jgi:hypothetical protein